MKWIYVILFVVSCSFLSCQKNLPSSAKIERITLDELDETHGYYLCVEPKEENIATIMLLLPGLGQKPEDIFQDTDLHQFAFNNNIMTVGFAGQLRIAADSFMVNKLDAILSDVIKRYNITDQNLVLGGFSAGGSIALRYTELCKQFPQDHPIQPAAVFMADAPVDLFHMWKTNQDLKKANLSKVAVDEANWVEKIFNNLYGGTPTTHPELFMKLSPFCMDPAKGNNESYLKDVAIRAYHDVDIPWRLKNRNQTVVHSNFFATSDLINRLNLLGNTQAEFIQTYQKGFRRNGQRHPHSWSIVDSKDCINWINNITNNKKPAALKAAQETKENVQPIVVDKKYLSGLNLSKGRNPSQPDRKLVFKNIFAGTDLRVQVVGSETAEAQEEDLAIDEFIFLTNGAAELTPENSEKKTFLAGDTFIVPRGYAGRWKTIGAPDYHYEISVTTIERNQNLLAPGLKLPELISKRKLAGLDFSEEKLMDGVSSENLFEGHEISVKLNIEEDRVIEINSDQPEQVIQILSGAVTLWDLQGNMYEYFSGDFFILPDGFIGTWKSIGAPYLRTLRIYKSPWKK